MDERVTIQEAMKLLGRSEKSVRDYIKNGRLSAEIGSDRKYHILRTDVDHLAKHPAEIQADKLTLQVEKLTRELAEMKARLETIEKQLEEATSQPAVQTPTHTTQPRRNRPERQPAEVTAASGNVPEGYVVFPHFLHDVPDTTAKRWINKKGGFTITEGKWIHNGHQVTKLLSPGQQHEYYLALHNHPQFKTCPDCPHGLAEE